MADPSHPHQAMFASARANEGRPVRWMVLLLALLAAGAATLALLWADEADAQSIASLLPDAKGVLVADAGPDALKCEMVRIWPLPADCQFVFGAPAR